MKSPSSDRRFRFRLSTLLLVTTLLAVLLAWRADRFRMMDEVWQAKQETIRAKIRIEEVVSERSAKQERLESIVRLQQELLNGLRREPAP